MDIQTLRGFEAPLVSDGVLFTHGACSVVYAIDARTGAVRWLYDPAVTKERAKFVCCGMVNRGVASSRDRVYVGTIDGRLIALDRKAGAPAWSVQTTPKDGPYAISGAPRIAAGRSSSRTSMQGTDVGSDEARALTGSVMPRMTTCLRP